MTKPKQDYLGRTVCIDCPNISYSDSGSWCCRLYDPYITDPQKQSVQYGTCGANIDCSYKLRIFSEQKLADNEREMDRIQRRDFVLLLLALLILLLVLSTGKAHAYAEAFPYNNNWYIRSDKSVHANSDRKTFDPPATGIVAKEPNKIQRILYRANKQHPLVWERYDAHLSNKEYTDCTYYKYVDCSNLSFCRCWQCRDYVYPVEWKE